MIWLTLFWWWLYCNTIQGRAAHRRGAGLCYSHHRPSSVAAEPRCWGKRVSLLQYWAAHYPSWCSPEPRCLLPKATWSRPVVHRSSTRIGRKLQDEVRTWKCTTRRPAGDIPGLKTRKRLMASSSSCVSMEVSVMFLPAHMSTARYHDTWGQWQTVSQNEDEVRGVIDGHLRCLAWRSNNFFHLFQQVLVVLKINYIIVTSFIDFLWDKCNHILKKRYTVHCVVSYITIKIILYYQLTERI